jgi:hypothetical protein
MRTATRIRSTPSPAHSAARSSEGQNRPEPSVSPPSVGSWRNTPRITPMAHPTGGARKPTTLRGSYLDGEAIQVSRRIGDRLSSAAWRVSGSRWGWCGQSGKSGRSNGCALGRNPAELSPAAMSPQLITWRGAGEACRSDSYRSASSRHDRVRRGVDDPRPKLPRRRLRGLFGSRSRSSGPWSRVEPRWEAPRVVRVSPRPPTRRDAPRSWSAPSRSTMASRWCAAR